MQSTFLCAIERADRYDGSRSLVAWLVGILVNEARSERRRSRRAVDPGRLADRAAETPTDAVEGLELADEIGRALETLSARDRDLLEATLRQEVAPIDFARQHGLAPGTVRMQLHRGIERLRRALPAGLALGGAAILSGGRGTAQVRARVLEAARKAHPAPLAAGAGAGSAIALGGSIVTKNLTLAAAALALVAGLYWIVGRTATDRGPAETAVAAREPDARPSGPRIADLAPTVPPDVAFREVAREPAVDEVEPGVDEAWAAALSGLTGRLVEADGAPVAGKELVLVELDFDEVRRAVSLVRRDAPVPRPVLDRTVSDAEGRFALHGARASALHAITGTPNSPRIPVRVVAEPLQPGETRDLGDVVLPAGGRLAGQVVDAAGRPVAGARVRVGPLPVQLLEIGAADLRPDGLLCIGDGDLRQVLAPPAWALRLEERLGLGRSTTDAHGTFVLDDLAVGAQTVVVDAPGRVSAYREVVVGPEENAPVQVVLATGRHVSGEVLRGDGDPAAGIEVFVGVGAGSSPVAVLRRIGRTGGDGRFACSGMSEGNVIVAARRAPTSPWTVVTADEDTTDVDVLLPESGTLRLRILDARGEPVADPEVTLLPDPLVIDTLRGLVPPPDLGERLRRTEDGVAITDLDQGSHGVSVRAEGYATTFRTVVLDREELALELRLASAPTREVLVRDGNTGALVPGAQVALLRAERGDGIVQDAATTDGEGRCRLHPATDEDGDLPASGLLRVQHPAFATTFREVGAGAGPIEVRLGQGGALQVYGRPGATGFESGLLVLSRRGIGDSDTRLLRLGEDGEALLTHLSTGTWDYELVPGWARDDSVLAVMVRDSGGLSRPPEHGTLEIVEGRTTELVLQGQRPANVDLEDGSITIEGRLRIGHAAPTECSASLQGPSGGEPVQLELAADGSFRFENVPTSVHVLVLDGPHFFGWRTLEDLRPGEQRYLDIDWDARDAVVTVVDESGEPVVGAQVTIQGTEVVGRGSTERGGRCTVPFLGDGPFRVQVQHPERGTTRLSLDSARSEVRVTLSPGIPCAGEIRLPVAHDGLGQLVFHGDGDLAIPKAVTFTAGHAPFSISGLAPGDYRVTLNVSDLGLEALSVTLGPAGDEALELGFERSEASRKP